jgi:hypothetical protein
MFLGGSKVTIIWKKAGPTEFVAKAWGMDLTLNWLPQEHRWAVAVDGARCRQRWHSCVAAIDECDAIAARHLRQLGGERFARQGVQSPIKVPLTGLPVLPFARRTALGDRRVAARA